VREEPFTLPQERVVIAEIIRPRGNRGEVVVLSQTDVPGRLESLQSIQARLSDGSDVLLEVEEAWQRKGDWVLKFRGVDSINEADRLRRGELWVPAEERAALPDGEFFRSDLIGCIVVNRATGETVGRVEGWHEYGGPGLLEVDVNGKEVLIPFVPELCEVDLPGRAIRVEVPEGLLTL
jgi:16S rRNA processing protein RimM